jgi:hypothetical protein
MGWRRVLFGFGVSTVFVMVSRLAVMMRCIFMVRSRIVMVLARRMFCVGHAVSSLCLSPS